MLQQTTRQILMVRPAQFGFNVETAANNAFQTNDASLSKQEIRHRALKEFDAFVAQLRAVGVAVTVIEDSSNPIKPDAVFPNNWITMHPRGLVILYPMYAPSRRLERQAHIVQSLKEAFVVREVYDISGYETDDLYLEGTGSMIFDHAHRLVYACQSPRTNEQLLDKFCAFTGYQKILFHATDANGMAIYHTNVMMAMGSTFVVICLESVATEKEKDHLLDIFRKTKKQVVAISMEQMNRFAGNMLQVRGTEDQEYLVMSAQAYDSLDPEQRSQLQRHTQLLYAPIPTIETYGGGSVRCMMAEIFLKKR